MVRSGKDFKLWERIVITIMFVISILSVILGMWNGFTGTVCNGLLFLALALIPSGLALYLFGENRCLGAVFLILGIVVMVLWIISLGTLKSC